MPILATGEPASPEAVRKANEMRELMARDLDELQIAKLVLSFDLGNFDLQMEAWGLLTWKEQNAWREFRELQLRENKCWPYPGQR